MKPWPLAADVNVADAWCGWQAWASAIIVGSSANWKHRKFSTSGVERPGRLPQARVDRRDVFVHVSICVSICVCACIYMFVLVADVPSLLLCSIYLVALLLVCLASRVCIRSLFHSSRLPSRVCNRSLFHSSPCCKCALTRSLFWSKRSFVVQPAPPSLTPNNCDGSQAFRAFEH